MDLTSYLLGKKSGGGGAVTSVNGQTGDVVLSIPTVQTTTSSTAGDVYDVTYINATVGDIETLLGGI